MPEKSLQDQVRGERHIISRYYGSGESLRIKQNMLNTVSGRVFEHWAVDLVQTSPDTDILDAGCGWGRFTWALLDHCGMSPDRIVCADLSPGMLQSTRAEGRARGRTIGLVCSSSAALPFREHLFGGVMANHVLYLLEDIGAAVAQLARVLAPGGWLLATTHSDRVSVPIIELHYRALDALHIAYSPEAASPFSMENGETYLARSCARIEAHIFEDEVRFDSVQPFMQAYLHTGRFQAVMERPDIPADVKERLPGLVEAFVERIIDEQGMLNAPVRMGAFVCRSPCP